MDVLDYIHLVSLGNWTDLYKNKNCQKTIKHDLSEHEFNKHREKKLVKLTIT